MHYDVFISYRRDKGLLIARSLQQALTNLGLKVFFDMEELRDGKFNEKLYDAIEKSKNVIFLMTEGALDRCLNDGDWVRNELEHVLEKGINLVPVAPTGTILNFPDGLSPTLASMKFLEVSELNLEKLFKESVAAMVNARLKGVSIVTDRERQEAEEAFLSQARRFKENDGQIDDEELKSLDQTGSELGINKARRIVLIEKVEKPIPVTVGVSPKSAKRLWTGFFGMLLLFAVVIVCVSLYMSSDVAENEACVENAQQKEDSVIFGNKEIQGDGYLRKAADEMFGMISWRIAAERVPQYDENGMLSKASLLEKEIKSLLHKGQGYKALEKLREIKAIYQSVLSKKIRADLAKIDRDTRGADGGVNWMDRYSRYDRMWRDSRWCEDYKIAWEEVVDNAYPGLRFNASVQGKPSNDVSVLADAKLEVHGGTCDMCQRHIFGIDCDRGHHGDNFFLNVLRPLPKFSLNDNIVKELDPFDVNKIIRVERGAEFGPFWFLASKNGKPYFACIPRLKYQWCGIKEIPVDLSEVDLEDLKSLVEIVVGEIDKVYTSRQRLEQVNKVVSAIYKCLAEASIVADQLSPKELKDRVLSTLRK